VRPIIRFEEFLPAAFVGKRRFAVRGDNRERRVRRLEDTRYGYSGGMYISVGLIVLVLLVVLVVMLLRGRAI
jgi:hypothetical protein